MDNFESIIGLPREEYEVTYQRGKIYGLAYFSQSVSFWTCNIGTLPYLFGCFETFTILNDELPDQYYMGVVFFELNESHIPIKVITSINMNEEFSLEIGRIYNVPSILRDVSIIDGNNIPKLEFRI